MSCQAKQSDRVVELPKLLQRKYMLLNTCCKQREHPILIVETIPSCTFYSFKINNARLKKKGVVSALIESIKKQHFTFGLLTEA